MERKIVKGKEGASSALSSKRKFKLIRELQGVLGAAPGHCLGGSHTENSVVWTTYS